LALTAVSEIPLRVGEPEAEPQTLSADSGSLFEAKSNFAFNAGVSPQTPSHRKVFRPLRRATKGSAFGNRKFFKKNLTKNFWAWCDIIN